MSERQLTNEQREHKRARDRYRRARIKLDKIQSGWQPICSAPQDEWMLVYCHWVNQVTVGKNVVRYNPRERQGWRVSIGGGTVVLVAKESGGPSHWMPLPEPPAKGAK